MYEGVTMAKGSIIFLNGVSSSGKTTIAEHLVRALPGFFHFSSDLYDDLIDRMEDRKNGRLIPVETEHYIHRTVRMFSDSGVNLVVDHILHDRKTRDDFYALLLGYPLMMVGVHCPPDIIDQREAARGDRAIGQGRRQLDFVHLHEVYDMEIDTHAASIEENVAKIVERATRRFGPLTLVQAGANPS